jgi:hypothetical protein
VWRSWHRREDSIKIDFKELVLEGMDWIHLARVGAKWRYELLELPKWRVTSFLKNDSVPCSYFRPGRS